MDIYEGSREEEYESYKNRIKDEYGINYNLLKWITPEESVVFEKKRQELLNRADLRTCAKRTKIYSKRLAPGCRICAGGQWSCLFISGICNGTCFYCPAPQNEDTPPVSQNIFFTSPGEYADYVEKLGFKGVGLSGGEPLIKLDLCLEYIRELRKSRGPNFHIWLYTNGILGTKEKFRALKDAGLNEIRFDIGATAYSLESVGMASEFFEDLTIEIPSVPEDLELLKVKLPEMEAMKVKYLNLHQLRITPHNFQNLSKRNYTYIHGKKALVAESEISALETINYCIEKNIDISVNYCSFAYKNRIQTAAARKKAAKMIREKYDDITENGYLRRIYVKGDKAFCDEKESNLKAILGNEGFERKGEKIYFRFNLFPLLTQPGLEINVEYHEPFMLPSISYYNFFREIKLNSGKKIFVERRKVHELSSLKMNAFAETEAKPVYVKLMSMADNLVDKECVLKYERIEKDLLKYF
ncbi:MAG: radical SAM protein [Desulfobacteraceae bacterium]|nr:radical SAM protein [Desulfobacteraceae bacterium]MCB9494963.1 radical SAM protein [Desulfobacteraceae bacterium]